MTAESMQDSTVPVGDKSMTFEVRLWLVASEPLPALMFIDI
jgi:hypothetical protein